MRYLRFLSFFSALLFSISCSSEKPEPSVIDAIKPGESKLTIGYNENIETLALIYNLSESGDFHFNKIPGPRGTLAKVLTQQFEGYRNHEAVIKLNALLDDGLVDMYDIILSLYNTRLPEFKQFAPYPSIYYENEGLTADETQARFDDFNESVIKFYSDTNLKHKFENDYKGLFAKIMKEVNSVAPTEQFIVEAESFYGKKRNSYDIIVSAFSFNGIGRAKLISSTNGTKAVSLVTSNHLAESDSIDLNKLDSFDVGYNDEKYFQEIGLHELIHTFLHESVRENKTNIALISEIEYLFTDSLKNNMMKQGYIDWRSCFEEHLVRVGEIKIAKRMGNNEFVSQYRTDCINNRGFIYFELVENIFTKFENNRSNFESIDDFIPELVNQMKLKVPNTTNH